MYNDAMTNHILPILALALLFGCQPKAVEAEQEVTETETPPEDDSTGTVTDSAEPEEPDPGPIGEWSTCYGVLTRDADSFSWKGNVYPCDITGASTYEDGILSLLPDTSDECEDLPWWFRIFEDENPSFASITNGSRLTLLPTVPTDPARVINLEETLVEEEWTLVNDGGNTNAFKLCWTPTGQFFEGRYVSLEDSSDFISHGGVITQVVESDEGEQHWSTQCAGNCPCGGVVTVEERTEDTLSGRYYASNCSRQMDGTFTATPHE